MKIKYIKGIAGWERDTHCEIQNLEPGQYYVYLEVDWLEEDVVEDAAMPMYTGDPDGGDYDIATTAKIAAADYKDAGDYNNALIQYNQAIMAAPPTALLLANRAAILLLLQRYDQSILDCNSALIINPDSAKAL